MFTINLLLPMLAIDPLSSRLERVYMGKMQSRTSAYNPSAVLQLPFVNIDPNNLSIMYTYILYTEEQRNKCGRHCITITFDHPFYAMQERWFWLMGHYPASPFGSKDFTSCFRPCVLPAPLWPEMVPMHSAYTVLYKSIDHFNETAIIIMRGTVLFT